MKTNCTILALFIGVSLFSQDIKPLDYSIGFGTNISVPYKRTVETMTHFTDHPVTDYKTGLSYFFEVLTSYNLNNQFYLVSGLNYNKNKLRIIDRVGFSQSKGTITTSYLNLPILLSYRFSDTSPIFVKAGPYIGYLLTAKEKGTTTIDTTGLIYFGDKPPIIDDPVQDYNNDIKENYTGIDFGLSAQFEYNLKISTGLSALIFTKFNFGLIDVVTNDIITNSTARTWKNYNLMVGLGLKYW